VAPSVQRRKVWLTPTTRVPCSNAAKTGNPLKLAGVPQTRQQISAISGPKLTILWGHVEEILLFNKLFPIANTCLSRKDMARQSCAMVPRWQIFGDFLRPAFPASLVQHISDLRSKFALGRATPCVQVWQTSTLRPMRLGEDTSGYAMVVHGRPKPLKIQVFWGSPSPQGSHSPHILGDTTRPGHVICVLV